MRADVYLLGDDPLHAWAHDRRGQARRPVETMPLAPPENVILRKPESSRQGRSPNHRGDIGRMLRVRVALVDRPLVERNASELSLEAPWARALATPLDA